MHLADTVAWALHHLARCGREAVLVFEQDDPLDELVRTGVRIDQPLSARLLISLFAETSAVHDGVVVVRDGQVAAAGCALDAPLGPRCDAVMVRLRRGRLEAAWRDEVEPLATRADVRACLEARLAPPSPLLWRLASRTARRLLRAPAPPQPPREVFVDALLDGQAAERLVFLLGVYDDTYVFGEEATGDELTIAHRLMDDEDLADLTPGTEVSLVFVGDDELDDHAAEQP